MQISVAVLLRVVLVPLEVWIPDIRSVMNRWQNSTRASDFRQLLVYVDSWPLVDVHLILGSDLRSRVAACSRCFIDKLFNSILISIGVTYCFWS